MTPADRIGFAGTPAFAATLLGGLLEAGYRPAIVYSQPDRRSGRGRKFKPSPVRVLAEAAGIPVETPRTLKDTDAQETLATAQLDLLIVAAYGLILPQVVLDLPQLGCLNVHASLLPRWRGAAPIERAIMAGDTESGVCLMQMEAGLDTGPVHWRGAVPINENTTGPTLEATLAETGVRGLVELLPRLEHSVPIAQDDDQATYAHKLSGEDSVIRWNNSAEAIERQVRALSGRQPAVTALSSGGEPKLLLKILKVSIGDACDAEPGTVLSLDKRALRIACTDKALDVTQVQLNRGQGKVLKPADLKNSLGSVLGPGTRLDAAL